MLDLGTVKPGSTIYIPSHYFDSNDPSASATASGFAVTDVKVYKNGGTTERASTSGFTLLDTDGIDFDGITGLNGLSIDLADNTTAGFYVAGASFWVVYSTVTVDAATISHVAATFRIGYPGSLLDTTIATLASQTSFTLTAGSADNDAYNHCIAVVHDVASAVQIALGYVSDYVGSTKTVTLAADPGIFTMAAADNISILPPANVSAFAGNAVNITNSRPEAVAERLGTQAKADVNAEADTALTDYNAVVPGDLPTNFGDLAVTASTGKVTVGTNDDKTGYRLDATGSAALTEGYATDGATATLPQLLYMIWSLLAEANVSGTTLTAKKLDGSTSSMTFTLDDGSNPTSITRAS